MYSPIVSLLPYKRSAVSTGLSKSDAVVSKHAPLVLASTGAEASDRAEHQPACESPPAKVSSTQFARSGDSNVKDNIGETAPQVQSAQPGGSKDRGTEGDGADQLETSLDDEASAALGATDGAHGVSLAGSLVVKHSSRTDFMLLPLCSRAVPLEAAIELAQTFAEVPAGTSAASAATKSPRPAGDQASPCNAAEQPAAASTQLTDQQAGGEGRGEEGELEEGELLEVDTGGVNRDADATRCIAESAADPEPASEAGKAQQAAAAVTILSGRRQVLYGNIVEPRRPVETLPKAPKAKEARKKRAAKAATASAAQDSVAHAAEQDQVHIDRQPAAKPAKCSVSTSLSHKTATLSAAQAVNRTKEGMRVATVIRPALPAAAASAVSRAAEKAVKVPTVLTVSRPAPKQTPAAGNATSALHSKSALAPVQPHQSAQAESKGADREALMRWLDRQARQLTEACSCLYCCPSAALIPSNTVLPMLDGSGISCPMPFCKICSSLSSLDMKNDYQGADVPSRHRSTNGQPPQTSAWHRQPAAAQAQPTSVLPRPQRRQ